MTLDPRILAVLDDAGTAPTVPSLPDDFDEILARVAAELTVEDLPPTGGVGLVLGSAVVPRLLETHQSVDGSRIDRRA